MATQQRAEYLRTYAKNDYDARKDEIAYNRLVKRIAAGTRPTKAMLDRFNLTQDDVSRIRGERGSAPERSEAPLPRPLDRCLQDAVESGTITSRTKINYLNKLDTLAKWLGTPLGVEGAEPLIAEPLIAVIDEKTDSPNSRKDYLGAILGVAKHCPEFKQRLEKGTEGLRPFADAMKRKIVAAGEHNKDKTSEDVADWETNILPRVEEVKKEHGADSQQHLIAQLYTSFPPLRDDYGNILISDGEPPSDAQRRLANGWLNLKKKTIHVYRHKTKRTSETLGGPVPAQLMASIKRSLKKEPREWLITNKFGAPAGQLSTKIKRLLGVSINELRHSYITNFFAHRANLSARKREELARRMGHSPAMQAMYIRAGEVELD